MLPPGRPAWPRRRTGRRRPRRPAPGRRGSTLRGVRRGVGEQVLEPRRRCSRRTSGSPRSARVSRTSSYGRSSTIGTTTVRPSTAGSEPAGGQGARRAARDALLDLDREDAGPLGEAAQRRGAEQVTRIDRDEEVAHPLDLAEEVAGHDDGDAELGAGPPDEVEHLVAAGRDRGRWSARRGAAASGRGRAPGPA